MAPGKKNGGRGADGGRRGGRHGRANHARGNGSGRGQTQANSAPSAAFLEALEAQRAKQAAKEAARQPPPATVEQRHSATLSGAAAAEVVAPNACHQEANQRLKRPALPGFAFDEERGRYFKLTKQDEQLQKKRRRAEEIAQVQAAERKARMESRVAAAGRVVARRSGWMGRLAQRETNNTPVFTDRSGLLPQYYGARLSTHELRSADVALDTTSDRFATMDINADASRVFIAHASGRAHSFVVNKSRELGTRQLELDDAHVFPDSTVSAVRFHPRRPGFVVVSTVGSGVSQDLATLHARGGEPHHLSGRVFIIRDSEESTRAWGFPDPWTVEWSPVDDDFISVGLHGDFGAIILHYSDRGNEFVAPPGTIKSDTMSQAFFPRSSSVIVNGCRDGSWWLWDTRVPRRASECVVNKHSKQVGAVQCVRVLSDERRMVLQRSNGELSVVDLRSPSHSLVTQVVAGAKDAYRPMLRFDMDANETVVVAATGSTVNVFDLHGGNELAHVKLLHESPSSSTDGTTDQVFLRDVDSRPTVWALSRSAVYRSHSLDKQ